MRIEVQNSDFPSPITYVCNHAISNCFELLFVHVAGLDVPLELL